MSGKLVELEGTWEEILAHADELAGCRVRVAVLAPGPQPEQNGESPPAKPASFRPASGRSLLRHAGTWAGDDLERCLEEVRANRTKARL
jgi:hypothetical protein